MPAIDQSSAWRDDTRIIVGRWSQSQGLVNNAAQELKTRQHVQGKRAGRVWERLVKLLPEAVVVLRVDQEKENHERN